MRPVPRRWLGIVDKMCLISAILGLECGFRLQEGMCRRVTRQVTLITMAWTIWRPKPQEGREGDCPQHGAQPPLLRGLGEHTSPQGKGWGGARGPVPSQSVGADSPAVKVCLSVPLHLLSPAETFPSKPKSHHGFSPLRNTGLV